MTARVRYFRFVVARVERNYTQGACQNLGEFEDDRPLMGRTARNITNYKDSGRFTFFPFKVFVRTWPDSKISRRRVQLSIGTVKNLNFFYFKGICKHFEGKFEGIRLNSEEYIIKCHKDNGKFNFKLFYLNFEEFSR